MRHPLANYQKSQIDGLGQRDLIIICYKGAIKYLEDAKRKHETREMESFSELIEKAHRVIFHLYTTLDMEQGGELAERLADLYVYSINQIYLVNATKETKLLDNIIKILSTLKEGWESIETSRTGVVSDKPTAASVAQAQILSMQV